jgi:hypothetical protein
MCQRQPLSREKIMRRRPIALALAAALVVSVAVSAQGRIKQHGKAIVEYRSEDVRAVASYEYAQRNHATPWLLIELAVMATRRIVIQRDELTLVGPDERRVPVATQQEFLDDHQTLTPLYQNASIWRRALDSYFPTRPTVNTLRFFAKPGTVVMDSAVTNQDQVAMGDLLFKSPDGKWSAGTYRLVLNHPQAKAELPIELR